MARKFLLRGLLCGLIAGLVVFAFARIFGEPNVDAAIGFEEHMSHAAEHMAGMADAGHHGEEVELVSREVQSSWGLLTGILVYATALGGIFGLLFSIAWGRMGRLNAQASAALLAGGALLSVYVVPFLKYPANPPSVGNADTIQFRTAIYLGIVAISIAGLIAAINLGRGLSLRFGKWNATIVAAVAYVAIVGIAFAILPPLDEVPDGFPATLLWSFRVTSFGMQLLFWTVLGLLFGGLTQRASQRRTHAGPLASPAR